MKNCDELNAIKQRATFEAVEIPVKKVRTLELKKAVTARNITEEVRLQRPDYEVMELPQETNEVVPTPPP